MPPTVEVQLIATPRAIYRSAVPFEVAESRLRSTIQRPTSTPEQLGGPKPTMFPSTEAFVEYVESRIGPHQFMHFAEFNHGSWLRAYYPEISRFTIDADGDGDGKGQTKNLRSIRFILGNPLIAKTMLKHDLDAGLSVPIELLLSEDVRGGSKVLHFQPVGLIAGYDGASQELVKAATALQVKADALINWILRDEDVGAADTTL